MEYGRREPMKSESAKEPTAFTMQTIQELLAEETSRGNEDPTLRYPMPKTNLQTPPHMRATDPRPVQVPERTTKPALMAGTAPKVEAERTAPPMPMPVMEAAPEDMAEVSPVSTDKPRSFLGRLIGR